MTARAKLQLVGDDAPAPGAPEDDLVVLFAREADLTRQLLDVRAAIYSARQRLRERDRLLMLPRCDLLRTRFGPKPSATPGQRP
jgi:hypothetical protein